MRITATDRRTINAFARAHRHMPVFSHCESAFRVLPGGTGQAAEEWLNLAYFGVTTADIGRTDLSDFGPKLGDLKNVEDHPTGRTVVDFYVYGRDRVGAETQLDTNVQAVWQDGVLIALAEGRNLEVLFPSRYYRCQTCGCGLASSEYAAMLCTAHQPKDSPEYLARLQQAGAIALARVAGDLDGAVINLPAPAPEADRLAVLARQIDELADDDTAGDALHEIADELRQLSASYNTH